MNLIISEWLYKKYSTYNEGHLTKKRSELVNKKFLIIIAKKLLLEDDIILGNSIQQTNKQTIDNILSDVIESIIGAIFIDNGIKYVKIFINKHLLTELQESKILNKNYKGMLIEKCHKLGYEEPSFQLIELKIKNSIKFQATLNIQNTSYSGLGDTKKKC